MAAPKRATRTSRKSGPLEVGGDASSRAAAPPGDARRPGDGGDPPKARGGDARTEGQRLLVELSASGPDIARAVGTTKQTVSRWRSGQKSPAADARAKLEAAYRIPVSSWDRVPGAAAPSGQLAAATAAADALTRRSTLEDVERVQAFLEKLFYDPALTPIVLMKFVDPLTKVLNLRRAVERDREAAERERTFRDARTVREHPEFARLVRLVIGAIHTAEDLRRVRDALEADGLRGVT